MVLRLVVLPVRLLFGTAKVSAKAGYSTAKGSARAGYVAGRAVGYKRLAVFGAGVAVGLVVGNPTVRQATLDAVASLRDRRAEEPDLHPMDADEAHAGTPA